MPEPNDPVDKSRRTLAAIVFTDIVDFSARTQDNEEHTLSLARRDMAAIRKICELCDGRVLKNTGDGLLMYFESAVQAVACAMRAQAHLAHQVEKLPPEETLQHRVGIHLGDVFVSQDDVMGDGVNVAARLQSQAPPGGICISQTVYDVVKNRLRVQVTPLGPKELKNIKEAVPVYQILLQAAEADAIDGGGARGLPRWALAAAAAVIVLAAGAGGWYLLRDKPQPTPTPAGGDNAATIQAPTSTVPAPPAPTPPEAPPAVADAPPAEPPAAETPAPRPRRRTRADRPSDADLLSARQEYLPSLDFAGMAEWLSRQEFDTGPLANRYRSLDQYRKIVAARIRAASEESPIVLPAFRDHPRIELWGDGLDVVIRQDGRTAHMAPRDVPLGVMARAMRVIARTTDQRRLVTFLLSEMRKAELAGP